MGRIKSTMIKKAARQMVSEPIFTEDFEHNKKVLGNSLPSKSMRNKIAGYVSRLMVMQRKEKTRKAKPEEPKEEVPQYEQY